MSPLRMIERLPPTPVPNVMREWADRTVAARVMALMYTTGAISGGLALALPNSIEQPGILWLLIAATGGAGVAISVAGSRIPGWAHFLLTSAGVGIVFAAVIAAGEALATYSLMFVWMVLYSAYFFTERFIVAELIWILGGFGVLLAIVGTAEVSPFTLWLLTAVVLSLTAYIISTVVRHRTGVQRELRRYFEFSLDMLCTLRIDGTVVEANRAWIDTFGFRPESLDRKNLKQLVHPDDYAVTVATAKRLRAGEDTIDFENRCRAVGGSWRWLNWRATFDDDRGLIYARATDITERKARLEEIRTEARRDYLTGLPNRRRLAEEIERETSRSVRSRSTFSVAMLDLDNFKHYNDTYGHLAGDLLLREAAEAWGAALRESDFIARVGGEEFVVLMPETELEDALAIAERVRSVTPERITCSAGVAEWSEGNEAEELLNRADLALYESKAAGRDRATVAPV